MKLEWVLAKIYVARELALEGVATAKDDEDYALAFYKEAQAAGFADLDNEIKRSWPKHAKAEDIDANLDDDGEDLAAQVEALRKERDQLHTRLRDTRTELEKRCKDVWQLTRERDEALNESEQWRNAAWKRERKIRQLRKERDMECAEAEDIDANLDAGGDDLAAQVRKLREVEWKNNEQLKARVKELFHARNQAIYERDEAKAEADGLAAQVEKLRKSLDAARHVSEALRKERDEAKAESARWRKDMWQLVKERDEAKAEADKYRRACGF